MRTPEPRPAGSPYDFADPLAEYERLTARITARRRAIDRNRIEIGIDLFLIERHGLHQLGGYTSLATYAAEKHGFTPPTTSELKSIGQACLGVAGFQEAMEQERIGFSAARELARLAGRDRVAAVQLLAKHEELTVNDVLAQAGGREPTWVRRFELEAEDLAAWDAAVAVVRSRHGTHLSPGQALGELCRQFLGGQRGESRIRTVYRRCPACETTSCETSAGRIPIEPAAADAALCAGEVLHHETGAVTRRIPARTRRKIEARHDGRCAVPGCRSRVIETHHEDGWEQGHDPERCLPLCRAHHKQRHRGWLRIELVDGEGHFYSKNGTYLGQAGADHKATDRARDGASDFAAAKVGGDVEAQVVPVPTFAAAKAPQQEGDPPRPATFAAAKPAAPQVVRPPVPASMVQDAVKLLRRLELGKREAEGLVQTALSAEPGRDWSLEDLVGEALRAMPTAHLTG